MGKFWSWCWWRMVITLFISASVPRLKKSGQVSITSSGGSAVCSEGVIWSFPPCLPFPPLTLTSWTLRLTSCCVILILSVRWFYFHYFISGIGLVRTRHVMLITFINQTPGWCTVAHKMGCRSERFMWPVIQTVTTWGLLVTKPTADIRQNDSGDLELYCDCWQLFELWISEAWITRSDLSSLLIIPLDCLLWGKMNR